MKILKSIINTCLEHDLTLEQCAYVFATAHHETNGTMEPVREAYWKDEGWRKDNLRYYPWYGRGYVQLTWEKNYIKAGDKLGVDLTTDPDWAMSKNIAREVLVRGMKEGWFTGKKLEDFINDHRKDFTGARKIVNGTDRADLIASYAEKYEAALTSSGLYKRGFLKWLLKLLQRIRN